MFLQSWLSESFHKISSWAHETANQANNSLRSGGRRTRRIRRFHTESEELECRQVLSVVALQVDGTDIVDPNGQAFDLRGVNIDAMEGWGGPGNPSGGLVYNQDVKYVVNTALTAALDWNANLIRLPLNQSFWLGLDYGVGSQSYRNDVDNFINRAAEGGAYVMLLPKVTDGGTGDPTLQSGNFSLPDENTDDFWASVATRYAGNPAVMFDLFNEPDHYNATYTQWKDGTPQFTERINGRDVSYASPGMQGLIDTIRSVPGCDNIITVEGMKYGGDLLEIGAQIAAGNALSDDAGELVYQIHIYPGKVADAANFAALDALIPDSIENNYPIYVGEWGADISPGPEGGASTSAQVWNQNMLDWLDTKPYSWTAWAMNAHPWLTYHGTTTPTTYLGQLVKDYLQTNNVVDSTPPLLTSISPLDNAISVAVSSNIVLGFAEPVVKGMGNILIRRSSDNSISQTIDVTSSAVTIAGTFVTINPADFNSNTGYYLEIPNTCIRDFAGNGFIGINGPSLWNFSTTADVTAPLLNHLSPNYDSTNVPISSNFVMGFTEQVTKGNGNILIRRGSDNVIVQSIDVNSPAITVAGSFVTINPADLQEGTSYYIEVPNTTITDLAGNAFIGIYGANTWNFSTGDATPPQLTFISPLDNAVSLPLNTNIVLKFAEPVVAGTGSIQIRRSNDNSIAQSIDVNSPAVTISGNVVTIDPADLAENTSYFLEFPNTSIKDLSGNNFIGINGPSLWNFTTGDFTPPLLTYISPRDDASAVPVSANIVLGFAETVTKGTGNILLRRSSDSVIVQSIDVASPAVTVSGNTVTVNPGDFTPGTGYYIEVPTTAILDSAGNSFIGVAGPGVWNFSTVTESVPPQLISISPLDNANEVPVSANIILGFNEPVAKGTGSIIIRRTSDNSVFQSIDVDSSSIQFSGTLVTIQHSKFAANTSYYLEVPDTTITDLQGNRFIGIVGSGLWNFTTVTDATPPQLVAISPLDNATGVPTNSNIILGFSETVVKGVGNILIKKTSDNSIVQSINISSSSVTINDRFVTIDPQELQAGTGYYIEVPNTVLLDLSGNPFIGIVGSTLWNFVTA